MADFRFDSKLYETFLPWILTGGAGMLGRLMFHAKQVQRGHRKPFGWVLLWDIPIALGMGWIALGLGVWTHIAWEVTVSLALATSYLGPYAIDLALVKWTNNKLPETANE